jgi:hypothetical protein
VRFIRTRLTPLMEKYEFELERVRREGTPAEQAVLFQGPPAEVLAAQAVQYDYEDKTCGTQASPPAANVVFGARRSVPYCSALGAFEDELDRIAASRFDPRVMRAVVTGDRFAKILDRLERTAPSEITRDVEEDVKWFRTRWAAVVERYGYDLRRIFVDATPEELAVFNRSHPDVLEHTSRETAYEEQVCSRG